MNDKETEKLDQAIAQQLVAISTLAESETVRIELLASQSEWEKFRNKACALQQSLMGGANSVNHARCMRLLTKQRLDYLEAAYR